MCKVSKKLKLCSCEIENTEQLKNYWVLYRFQKNHLIGQVILPYQKAIEIEDDNYNRKHLTKMLNAGNCFGTEIKIEDNDIFELNFSNLKGKSSKTTTHLVYEFIYREKKWKFHQSDPLFIDKFKKTEGKII